MGIDHAISAPSSPGPQGKSSGVCRLWHTDARRPLELGRAGQPKGLAIAGIIVGALLTILGIIGIILFVTVIAGLVGMCAELGPGVWDVDGITYRCG